MSDDTARQRVEEILDLAKHTRISEDAAQFLADHIAQQDKEIEDLKFANDNLTHEVDIKNTTCGDALEKLWQEIIIKRKGDKYGPWEYAAMAYRHIRDEVNEIIGEKAQQDAKLKRLRAKCQPFKVEARRIKDIQCKYGTALHRQFMELAAELEE